MLNRSCWRLARPCVLSGYVLCAYALAQDEDERIDLSPLSVTGGTDTYSADTTLAATLTESSLKDFGASIAVVTEQFLKDLGATDSGWLLPMIGNMEVGGAQGNFSSIETSDSSTLQARIDPEEAQRVRGLGRANLTRDRFRTLLPFDEYNTPRVTINRGQNSILYGLGSPGGNIDASTSRAFIGEKSSEFSIRFDHRGGHRESINLNRTILPNRLALRFAALNESIAYKQKPTFEDDQRIFLAWDSILLSNERNAALGRLRFSGNIERADIVRNPPDVAPPIDGFSSWFHGIGGQTALNDYLRIPGRSLEDIPSGALKPEWVSNAIEAGLVSVPDGISSAEYAALEGTFIPKAEYNRITGEGFKSSSSTIPYQQNAVINFNRPEANAGWNHPDTNGAEAMVGLWRPSGFEPQRLRWSNPVDLGAGFTPNSLRDRNVFDYHNRLWQGATNRIADEYTVSQLQLVQELFEGKAGIELAFNRQTKNQSRITPLARGDGKTIAIDITSHLAPADSDFDGVPDRLPNENIGRPVLLADAPSRAQDRTEWETVRAIAYAKFEGTNRFPDLFGKLLGDHSLTGLYENFESNRRNQSFRGVWWAANGDPPSESFIQNGDNNDFRRWAISQIYLGEDARGLARPRDLGNLNTAEIELPRIGDSYDVWYFDSRPEVDGGARNTWNIIEAIGGASLSKQTVESYAVNLQSHFLWNNLVTTIGLREDHQQTFRDAPFDELRGPTGTSSRLLDDPGLNPTDGNFNIDQLNLSSEPDTDTKGDTQTLSYVGHYPENWLGELPFGMDISLHYYEAESFEPDLGYVNILLEPIVEPRGETQEWGATVSLWDGRLVARLNRFETFDKNEPDSLNFTVGGSDLTQNQNNRFGILGAWEQFTLDIGYAEIFGTELFPTARDARYTTETIPSNRDRVSGTDADLIGVNSWDEYYDRLVEILPPELQAIHNYGYVRSEEGRRIDFSREERSGPMRGTQDVRAKGTEIDITGRLTENWVIHLNAAQQETIRTNIGPIAYPFAFEILERIKEQGLYDIRSVPALLWDNTIGRDYEREIRAVQIEMGQEGIASQEQREWRINALARYDFRSGPLKGFSLGGALRYQDEVAAGYTDKFDESGNVVPDVDNPFMGPDELNGDIFARYTRALDGGKKWTIQINARNLYRKNGDHDIPVRYNPDGRLSIVRIPNQQEFFLTNTLSF